MDLAVEDRPPQIVDLEVALEAGRFRQVDRVDRLDCREVRALVGHLLVDRVEGAVAEQVVGVVDADERREGRVVAQKAPEPRFDEVVEPLVQRPRVGV